MLASVIRPDQAAHYAVGGVSGGGHIAGGVAGVDLRAGGELARQAAQQVAQLTGRNVADAGPAGGYSAGGVTVVDRGAGAVGFPHQAARDGVAATDADIAGGVAAVHIGAGSNPAQQAAGAAVGVR